MMVDDAEAEGETTTEDAEFTEVTIPSGSADLFDDFEQGRIVASVRQRLFGRGPCLRIGRFEVERRLGAGGMGEVYLAVDPELARKVAVKRVLTDSWVDDEHDRERLRREAQALARLSHPNVVQVYEIGEHQDRTFVAMEYVDGPTLTRWLEAEAHSWRSILARFVAAGRGLAAAHDAGLVHRDFKPDNVLINRAGEVRVVDFGLALAGRDPRARDGAAVPKDARARLSASGAVMGTVCYMALEQLRGVEVDARSDQFSFCVALYEALWGQPPFTLDSVHARLHALERGPASPPRSSTPARVWWILRRGLDPDPARRWPDMHALLDALASVARRRALAWASAAAVVIAAAGFLAWPSQPGCEASARELDGVWDDGRRTELEARFVDDELGAAHVAASRAKVIAGLDRWSSAWSEARVGVCEDGRERSSATLHQQELCLTRQRRSVASLVDLLAEAEADQLARAVEAVAALPEPSRCRSEAALLEVPPPPPALAADVEELRLLIEQAHQLRLLGRFEDARARSESLVEAVAGLDYLPLQAELGAERAALERSAGSLVTAEQLVRAAIDRAEVSHHDALAAELWLDLALWLLDRGDDPSASAEAVHRAEIANDRAGERGTLARARLRYAHALLDAQGEDRGAAEAALREAIALAEASPTGDYPTYLGALAKLVAARDGDEALGLRREALAAAELRFGPHHPNVATYAYQLAVELRGRDRDDDEAEALLSRAVDLWLAAHERPDRKLAWAERILAERALARGELELAERHLRSLVEIQAEVLPPGHREFAEPELLLAILAGAQNQRALALRHCQAAIAIWAPQLPPEHPNLVRARYEAASSSLALRRFDEAAAEFALVIEHGDGAAATGGLLGFAELELVRGAVEGAGSRLSELDARLDRAELPPLDATDRYTHALLWAVVDLRRQRSIASRRDALADARAAAPFSDEQIAAWLDELGLDARERDALGLR